MLVLSRIMSSLESLIFSHIMDRQRVIAEEKYVMQFWLPVFVAFLVLSPLLLLTPGLMFDD